MMKTIGLIGGMSWESSKTYYSILNEMTRDRLGGLHSARLVMVSLDFHDLEPKLRAGDWGGITAILSDAAQRCVAAGAESVLIGSNTMHRVHADVERAAGVPCFHIARVTGAALASDQRKTAGLLGTKFTMQAPFFADELKAHADIATIVPMPDEQDIINQIIFDELCMGVIKSDSRKIYQDIMTSLQNRGADSIILGCTEIEMLIKPDHAVLPLYDTIRCHAGAAMDWALDLPSGTCR
ncbi:MAG: aspartate/glutamate racemase family protein [Candidatus Puniceispirillales bacterium]